MREDALDLAGRLETQLFAAVPYEHADLVCGASIGIALYPDDAATTTTLMNNADLAMYRAKGSLTAAVCFYEEEMDERVRLRRKEPSSALCLVAMHAGFRCISTPCH